MTTASRRHDISLAGSPTNAAPMKLCQGACKSDKPPEGGVQLTPAKWVCAGCWVAKQRKMRR
jgi:hypothetical protein